MLVWRIQQPLDISAVKSLHASHVTVGQLVSFAAVCCRHKAPEQRAVWVLGRLLSAGVSDRILMEAVLGNEGHIICTSSDRL